MSTTLAPPSHVPDVTNGRVQLATTGGKGYVARLVGTHGRYGFEREFVRGDRVKHSTSRYYEISDPGWYEHVSYLPTGTRQVTYYAFTGEDIEVVPTTLATREALGKAFGGPAPGQPGAWRSLVCQCGGDAYSYTANGYPRCWTHTSTSQRDDNDRPDTEETT